MTAKDFWRLRFNEEPKTDADKLAVVMMQEYHAANKSILSAADIRVLIAEKLPYYESHDKDDFVYIAKNNDIERLARELHQLIYR